MLNILKSLFGTKNDRELRKIAPILTKINTLEAKMQNLSDSDLKAKTAEFKARYQKGESLDSLLAESFAVVREAGKRCLGKRHFDVQLIGGYVLHQGKIAEMRTGEGKTLTATAPVYLNALSSKGVHVVTVNEYLASTQSEEMGKLYTFLGLTTGCILSGMSDQERQQAYACDVTYATNNELGFDYLRDNMKVRLEDFVQRGHHFSIVDEVDSILIDEARTPLIISGPSDTTSDKYLVSNNAIRGLRKEIDYTVDEKSRACALSEAGISKVEKRLNIENLFDPENNELVHACNNALRAHVLFRKDDHYIVQNGQIIIVDEFTGRLMHGRRFSDGLHQALEAKENVQIQPENQTLAQVTLQNYFRMYAKLSGMTGTADTEAVEFHNIYKLNVVVIPTNRQMVRKDHDDVLFLKQATKFNAVADEIDKIHKTGQPILVGTVSIEKSELLSELLKKKNIPHQVLNAKHHEQEAHIIAEAGQKNRVTLSTNMAGRGTDIILGQGVADLGGLYVIGTERHESRRIDNQLRGRSGRQGDPGTSKFFLSWEDELMKRFNNKANQFIMEKFVGDEAIHDPRLTNVIGKVQKRVEGFNYDIRKQLLQYDDVLNQQRKAIYAARMRILRKENVKEILTGEPIQKFARTICDDFAPPSGLPGELVTVDYKSLERVLFRNFNKAIPFTIEERNKAEIGRDEFYELITKKLISEYEEKETLFGSEQMRDIERWVMLQTVDSWWKDHLLNIDHLKDGIGLRGYAQKDPLQEYKNEAFELFIRLIVAIKQDSLQMIYKVQPNLAEKFIAEAKAEVERKAKLELKNATAEHEDPEIAFENKLEEQEELERKRAMYSER